MKKHDKNLFLLDFNDGLVWIRTQKVHEISQMYKNEFLMPYKMRREIGENEEIWRLDEREVSRLTEMFWSSLM